MGGGSLFVRGEGGANAGRDGGAGDGAASSREVHEGDRCDSPGGATVLVGAPAGECPVWICASLAWPRAGECARSTLCCPFPTRCRFHVEFTASPEATSDACPARHEAYDECFCNDAGEVVCPVRTLGLSFGACNDCNPGDGGASDAGSASDARDTEAGVDDAATRP